MIKFITILTITALSGLFSTGLFAQDGPGWTYHVSSVNHTIGIQASATIYGDGSPVLEDGDVVGVFYDSLGSLGCAGFNTWVDGQNMAISAWGDDDFTPEKDGMALGEPFKWKIWKKAENTVYDAVAYFDTINGAPGIMAVNGISLLDSIRFATDEEKPPWYFTPTDSFHTILIPMEANPNIVGTPLSTGDYIGVFYDSSGALACAGYVRWPSTDISIKAYGDEFETPVKEGFYDDEVFTWKFWRRIDQKQFIATAKYDSTYDQDSLYVDGGLSRLTGLYVAEDTIPIPDYEDIINVLIRFGPIELTSSYRLIGLPGDTLIAIDKFFRELFRMLPIQDWVAFNDVGDELYMPYTESTKEEFVFSPGKAFWILSKKPFKIDSLRVPRVPLNENNMYELPLRYGWNVISNPFNATIDWNVIKELNNVEDEIWSFSQRGVFDNKSPFQAVRGYYYYNRLSYDTLVIPYTFDSGGFSKPFGGNQSQAHEKKIKMSITYGDATSTAYIIDDPNSSATLDNGDLFAPPGEFEITKVFLLNEKLETDWKKLYTEARPFKNEGETFTVVLKAPVNKEAQFSIEIPDEMQGYSVMLFHEKSKECIDINASCSMTMPFPTEYKQYKLVVGKTDYLKKQREGLLPEGFALHQNFPNPFNPETTIKYTLTQSADVNLTIFNAVGENVKEYHYAGQQSGYYEVNWNAAEYASGIYLCVLDVLNHETGSRHRAAIKMLLIK